MWTPVNTSLTKSSITGILTMLFFAASCSGSVYTTQHFSFPPGSKPHESNWQYMALIIVSSKKSPITSKSKKTVNIKIYDRSNTIFLDEAFEFTNASIRANIVWFKFEEFKVKLIEVGNKYAKDSYNKQLFKSAPNRLIELTYHWDQQHKKFKNPIDRPK